LSIEQPTIFLIVAPGTPAIPNCTIIKSRNKSSVVFSDFFGIQFSYFRALRIFELIYFGKRQLKSVKDIAKTSRLSEKAVLTAGKGLADNNIILQKKTAGGTAYGKVPFCAAHKKRILDYPTQKKAAPTRGLTRQWPFCCQVDQPRTGYAARRTSFNATLSFAFRFLTR
jgi:hypothetical protein